MGVKDRRTKILLSLFLLSDVNFSPISFDNKLQKAFDISLNQKTRGTLSGMIKEELITKEIRAHEISEAISANKKIAAPSEKEQNQYLLTEKGFLALCLEFPFFRFLKDKWDGRWRIISYEIPESKREIRDRLRREMQGWGLGPWHRSFWLTPHPIIENLRQLIFQKEEEKYVQAFESDHSLGGRETLIEKVWSKSALDKKYRELFKKWHEVLSKDLPGDKQEEPKIEKFKRVVADYITLLREDPGLPTDLLGQNWIGFEAYNIFKEIRSILLS